MKKLNALVFCSVMPRADEIDHALAELKIEDVSFRAVSEAGEKNYLDKEGKKVTLAGVDLVVALDNRSYSYLLEAKKLGLYFEPRSAGYALMVPVAKAPVPASPTGPDRRDVRQWLFSPDTAQSLRDTCIAAADLS